MKILEIRLLGAFQLSFGDHVISDSITPKSISLFACLALERGRVCSRTTLATLFWPNLCERRGRRALNTELWRLSEILRKQSIDPASYISCSTHCVSFKPAAPYWLDVEQFEAAVRRLDGMSNASAELQLKEFSSLTTIYRGDLLEHVNEEWCAAHREKLRHRYTAALEPTMRRLAARQDWLSALVVAEKLLELDPLMEHIHCAAMRYYFLLGNRPAAVRQFAACSRILRDELDLAPLPETLRVFKAIRDAGPTPSAPPLDRPKLHLR